MKKKILAAVLAASMAFTANANAFQMKGLGTVQCGDLINSWNQMGPELQPTIAVGIHQWTFGYMSGLNRRVPEGDQRDLSSLEADNTAALILSVCESSPESFVIFIVEALYNRLPYQGVSS